LSQFKFINNFKPILDAYRSPYKDRFYYWTGIQLLLRAVFYGISALDRNTNMMIGIITLGALECIYGIKFPFKSKMHNYQELLLICNLHILFVISIYTTSNYIAVNISVGLVLVQVIALVMYRPKLHRNFTLFLRRLLKSKSKYFSLTQLRSTFSPQHIEL